MRIEKGKITNFRMLEDVEISLETDTTVIVGRNNSGKTSLTEVFDRLIGEKAAAFKIEDFSAGSRHKFLDAKKLKDEGAPLEDVLATLPSISVTLTLRYDPNVPDLGPLADFIIDLDVDCVHAMLRVDYSATLLTLPILFDIPELKSGGDTASHFFRGLKDTLPKAYSAHLFAIDPTDLTNERALDLKLLSTLFQCGFVRAQRALDQSKKSNPDVLGKLLETLFATASASTAKESDQALAAELKLAVEAVEKQIHGRFNEKILDLLPTFDMFNYPGLNEPQLTTETNLNVESLLSEHTKVFYTGTYGIHLPEGYNGLGTRNLIYILLQLMTFHKAYRARPTLPGVHLIFIEEPEAHLHPQMQEVFIKQLAKAVAAFSNDYPAGPTWQVQFVISTHSSHLTNVASFEAIRYFMNRSTDIEGIRRTQVKDFKKGQSDTGRRSY
jgi:predicted ATP-dependent endonuclease of OLD family